MNTLLLACALLMSSSRIVDTASLENIRSVPVGAAPHDVYQTGDGKYVLATALTQNGTRGVHGMVVNRMLADSVLSIDAHTSGKVPKRLIAGELP